MTKLTADEGKKLLKLARETIAGRLGVRSDEPVSQLTEGTLQSEQASFVTLKKQGALRGCIGSLVPTGTVVESVRQNAVKAAFNDSRFQPLSRDEFDDIHIDISILTPAKALSYKDGDDLISKLRPGIDGVTIRLGISGATFLPQVWKQLPEPEKFLAQLCRKAGLSPTAWKDQPLEVETYQVQCFEEDF